MNKDVDQLKSFKKILKNWKQNQIHTLQILKRLQNIQITFSLIKETKINQELAYITKFQQNQFNQKQILEIAKQLYQKCKSVYKNNHLNEKNQQINSNPIDQLKFPNLGKQRNNILKKLAANYLKNMPSSTINHQNFTKIIIQLQQHLKENNYKKKVQLLSTLSHIKTVKAKQNILEMKYDLKDVAMCKMDIFMPQQQQQKIEERRQKFIVKSDADYYKNVRKKILTQGNSQGFFCINCKKKQGHVTGMFQIRASDQPMTIFYQCMNCGKKWKQ